MVEAGGIEPPSKNLSTGTLRAYPVLKSGNFQDGASTISTSRFFCRSCNRFPDLYGPGRNRFTWILLPSPRRLRNHAAFERERWAKSTRTTLSMAFVVVDFYPAFDQPGHAHLLLEFLSKPFAPFKVCSGAIGLFACGTARPDRRNGRALSRGSRGVSRETLSSR
jgi:hypothetical protein